MNRYIIGGLALVGLILLLVILLLSSSSHPKVSHKTPLVDYANTSATVEMVVDGPIVAPTKHNTLDINVNQLSASANLIQGYDNNITNSLSYTNSENSFKNFLYALFYAGYSSGASSTYKSDIGLCAFGDRYDFYLKENGQVLQHYWMTNCSGEPRTYTGNLTATINLFNDQIPDITSLTNSANL